MTNNFTSKNQYKYFCEICDFKCIKKGDYNRHLGTAKHKKSANTTNFTSFTSTIPLVENEYNCDCGKKYKHLTSLYKHRKTCNYDSESNKNEDDKIDYKIMFIEMLGENKKLQNLLVEQQKQSLHQMQAQQKQINKLLPIIGNNTTNNTTNNTNFNINMFLNEKCKDAISIESFIDNIEISLNNLLFTKDNGLIDGITNIFVENMNKLSLYERPIHCTDKKRETIYIKNRIEGTQDSQWSKDEENREVEKAINKVSRKQMQNLKQWTEEHPDFMENNHLQKEYTKLISSCSGDVNNDKITKKLCDKVYLTNKDKKIEL